MTYWPGTKIQRSTGNAFDWRAGTSAITSTREFKQSQHSTLTNAGNSADKRKQFTIYTKARAAK